MAQTDRQTDKASHWKTAVFDVEDNWSSLDATPPEFVKRIHRQKEVCPTTGQEHYQIHVECNRQVRLSQMTAWIKRVKWFAVLGKQHIENSIKYCSKKDSAVPGTQQVVEGQRYYQIHDLLREVAKHVEHYVDNIHGNDWDYITCRLVRARGVEWVTKLSNPALKRLWEQYKFIFIDEWETANEAVSGAFIIEAPPNEGTPAEPEGVLEFVED